MASGQLAGLYGLATGSNPESLRPIREAESGIWDNAAGSNPFYLNGVEKSFDDGVPLMLGPGPHVGPGENLYVTLISDTSDILDSDDTLAVILLQIARYALLPNGALGPRIGQRTFRAVSQRNTTENLGGVADDPNVISNRRMVAYAFGPCPAGEAWTLFGRAQLDLRDDTA